MPRLALRSTLSLALLAAAGGCQLLIGLDGGKAAGAGGAGGDTTSATSSTSATTSSTASTTSTTSGTGGGMHCAAPSDCPKPDECHKATCDNGLCGLDAKTGSCTMGGKVCGDLAGPAAGTCVDCNADGDCGAAMSCVLNGCVPQCMDGTQNGAETDKDCGGGTCPPCGPTLHCTKAADCDSLVCTGNVCQTPSCTDGTQNEGEIGVDCGGPCAPCPLLLAGGASGAMGVLGAALTGATWTTQMITGSTPDDLSLAIIPSTQQGVGVVHTAANNTAGSVQATLWDGTSWSAFAPIGTDSALGQPSVVAAAGVAYVAFWDASYKYDLHTYTAGAWAAMPAAITPTGTASQPCGPNAAVLAPPPPAGSPSVLFVNGNCAGPLNHLLNSDLNGATWLTAKDVAQNPSFAATQRPALALSTSGAEMVAAYIQQGAAQIYTASRTTGAWTTPVALTNGLTSDPIALAPLSAGGAVMAYRGTDGNLYVSIFGGVTWSAPASPFAGNTAIKSSPALAKGFGSARAEMAYVDSTGAVWHTRLASNGTWSNPMSVATSGYAHVAIATGP